MENHIDLVNIGLTIKHHIGWQDYNDLATQASQITLTEDVWVEATIGLN